MKGAFLRSKKTVVVLAALFFAGVLFYCLSEYHTGEETTGETTLFDEAAYEARVEEKLKNMIAAVCRDENVHLFVMLEGAAVYCYEKETTKSDTYAETSLLFRSDQSGNKAPVLTRTFRKGEVLNPQGLLVQIGDLLGVLELHLMQL